MHKRKHLVSYVPHSWKGAEQQALDEDVGQPARLYEMLSPDAKEEKAVLARQQARLRELAAETAHLQRLLADVYPELARLQRRAG